MCGISGIVGSDSIELVKAMSRRMLHRGPDDTGLRYEQNVCLGHTRLSIIDISNAGHQPMSNEDDTVWITFNGEIYNFEKLKTEMEKAGHNFRSKTDTEVIVHLYEEYGERCLDYLRGMFSLAIWDRKKARLFAARDRFGIKPFFYCFRNGRLIFSSELKAMLASGFTKKDINTRALEDYFAYGCVPAPQTMVKDVFQLLPAHYLIFENSKLSIKRYWGFPLAKKMPGLQKTEQEHLADIRTILNEAVKIRMVSDVPLGAFLSGGVDSSVIVALMQKHSTRPVKSFSIVFEEEDYDEREFSEKIARKFNTDHKQILLKQEDIIKTIPAIFDSMDQPSMDGFNTFVISRAVKRAGITVALSGLGGDELFGGYSSFKTLPMVFNILKTMRLFPGSSKAKLAFRLKGLTADRQKLKLIFSFLGCENLDELYYLKRTVFLPDDITNILAIDYEKNISSIPPAAPQEPTDAVNRLSFLEITNYLQNMLLQDTDRMSMANSLEIRVPFLDHILVENMFTVPGHLKVGSDFTKRLLIRSTQDLLPREVYSRPKKGFVFPFQIWLKEGLKDYCSDALSSGNLEDIPCLNSNNVNKIWQDFLNGGKLYNYTCILTILSFVNWYKRNVLDE
ncbi:MAG: asparagine synthase (glutamine-hydrolyzing) [Candidatus Omnitrophica bacterium]|nr:asparagine synthase (glutamine-hydrolyzing) [Candidatus Omnitrophota bacterium]